jgi:hypothetical protein
MRQAPAARAAAIFSRERVGVMNRIVAGLARRNAFPGRSAAAIWRAAGLF